MNVTRQILLTVFIFGILSCSYMPGYRSYIKTTFIGSVCTDENDSLIYFTNYSNRKTDLFSYHLYSKKLTKYNFTDTTIIEIMHVYKSGARIFLRIKMKGNNDITFQVNNNRTLTQYTSDSHYSEIEYLVAPDGENLFTFRTDFEEKKKWGDFNTYLIIKSDTAFSNDKTCYKSKGMMIYFLDGYTKGGLLLFTKDLTVNYLESKDNAIYAMEPFPPYKIIDLRPEEGIENDDNIWGFHDMYSVSPSKYSDSVYVTEPIRYKDVIIKSISNGGQRPFTEIETDLSYQQIDNICDFDNLPFLVARLDQVRLVIKNIKTNDVTEINTDSFPDEIKEITFIY